MDLGEGDSPWGDVPSQSSQPPFESQPAPSQEAETPQPSQPSVKAAATRGPRKPIRRLQAQPTTIQADDPLGPLGPLGDNNAGPAADSQADEPPVPPLKEQMVIRTTMPPSAPKPGPKDPHQIEDEEDYDRPSGPRAPPPVQPAMPSPVRSTMQPSVTIEQAAKPSFQITVGDPHKVGDLTSSHIVYSVRTRTTSKGYKQPEFEVKRRYRDFLWLYNTMHGNNPGVVVPPPPEKQALNRFETNFVESRRQALEKMLNKIAAHPTLQHDPDLKLFLESEAFSVDVKHKERREPIPGESKGVLGSLGISVGSSNKFVEQDDVSTAAAVRSADAYRGC